VKYILQSNWSFPRSEDGWRTFGLNPDKKFDNLHDAIRSLTTNSNLSRMCCDLRVIDESGKIHCYYDVESDTRLPGCRWRIVQREAYYLWEKTGRPEGRSEEFWAQAEEELKECKGVFMVEN
jgi:hypothetical protein